MSELIKTPQQKQDVLNKLVEKLIQNESVKEFFLENDEVIKSITPFDVFSISFFQEESKLGIEEIKQIAGKLINLIHNGLEKYQWEKTNTSYLMKCLLDEGKAIRDKFASIKPLIKELNNSNKEKINNVFLKLKDLSKRFLKMQNIIYPHLEKKMVNPKPLQIMWSLHDDARDLLKDLSVQFQSNDPNFNKTIGKYFFLVYGILEKEELLVLPIASRVIKEAEWKVMFKESLEYGFSFLDVDDPIEEKEIKDSHDFKGLLFTSETGGLTLEELILVFNRLPLDLTFVDEFNQVKYFNNAPSRIFPRSPSVIGRQVSKCHPPKSVHLVEEIVEEFRKGAKNEAKFWLEIRGRFIVITYYAIRDKIGRYKGVLEVSQDVTEIRNLTGEQRLLNWAK
jgi:hypothetical protein